MPIKDVQGIPDPDDKNIAIWRYMDFTKFVSMLEEGGLFFARSDNLGDPFEGSRPRRAISQRERVFTERGIPHEWSERIGIAFENLRRSTFINCWHMNECESIAMWKLYASSNEAIAIRSQYSLLRELLDEPGDEFLLAPVKYVDFDNDELEPDVAIGPFFHKRKSFEHEREVRAVALYHANTDDSQVDSTHRPEGCLVELDLGKLIQNVYVAPTAPAWFRTLTAKVVTRYEYNFDVTQSALDSVPIF